MSEFITHTLTDIFNVMIKFSTSFVVIAPLNFMFEMCVLDSSK